VDDTFKELVNKIFTNQVEPIIPDITRSCTSQPLPHPYTNFTNRMIPRSIHPFTCCFLAKLENYFNKGVILPFQKSFYYKIISEHRTKVLI
jgi:hypothetical protein